jgi:hypothetical protein
MSASRDASPMRPSGGALAGLSITYGPPSGRFRSPLHELFLVPAATAGDRSPGGSEQASSSPVQLCLASPLDISSAAFGQQILQQAVVDYRCPACFAVVALDHPEVRYAAGGSSVRVCPGCVMCPRCSAPAFFMCSRTMEAWMVCPACDWRTARFADAAALTAALTEHLATDTGGLDAKRAFADLKRRLAAADESATNFSSSGFHSLGKGGELSTTREGRLQRLDEALDLSRRKLFETAILGRHLDPAAAGGSQSFVGVRSPELVLGVRREKMAPGAVSALRSGTLLAASAASTTTARASVILSAAPCNVDFSQSVMPSTTPVVKRVVLAPRIGVCVQKDSTNKGRSGAASSAVTSWMSLVFPATTHLNDLRISSDVQLSATLGKGSRAVVQTSSAVRWLPLLSLAENLIPDTSATSGGPLLATVPGGDPGPKRRLFFWLSNLNDHVVVRVMSLRLRQALRPNSGCSASMCGDLADCTGDEESEHDLLWCGVTLAPHSKGAPSVTLRDYADAARLLAIAESAHGVEECGHRMMFYVDVSVENNPECRVRQRVLTFDIRVELQLASAASAAGPAVLSMSQPHLSRRDASMASASSFMSANSCSSVKYVCYVVLPE